MFRRSDDVPGWHDGGAQQAAQRAYDQIADTLETAFATYPVPVVVDQQGSLATQTGIGSQLDIDVVVELCQPMDADTVIGPYRTMMSPDDLRADRLAIAEGRPELVGRYPEFTAHQRHVARPWEVFRRDVWQVLAGRFGPAALATGTEGYLELRSVMPGAPAADIVVVQSLRGPGVSREGRPFLYWRWPAFAVTVGNAELHKENTRLKNKRTDGAYRAAVRALKAQRDEQPRQTMFDRVYRYNLTSYFIECLLYNVPDDEFSNRPRACLKRVLAWLERYYDRARLRSFQVSFDIPSGMSALCQLTANPFYEWAASAQAYLYVKRAQALLR
jgi:hypothetical protein